MDERLYRCCSRSATDSPFPFILLSIYLLAISPSISIHRERLSRHSTTDNTLSALRQDSSDGEEDGDKGADYSEGTDAARNVEDGLSPSSAVAKAASAITGAMQSLLPIGSSPSGNAAKEDEDLHQDSRKLIAAKQDDYESDDDDEELHLRLATTSRVYDVYDEEEADDWGDDGGWKTHNIDRRRKTRRPTAKPAAKGVFNVFNW